MPANTRACIVSTPHPAQMFLFTHLDHDVELMIVAKVEELTKFRACTREFKQMMKTNHKFIEHSKVEYCRTNWRGNTDRTQALGPQLTEGNVYLRMVCMGVLNMSRMTVTQRQLTLEEARREKPTIHQYQITEWEDTIHNILPIPWLRGICGDNRDRMSSYWVDRHGENVNYRKPMVEQIEFQREQKRDIWGVLRPTSAQLHRVDHIPAHIKGLKLQHPLSYFTCAQIDTLLGDLGAVRYKSKRKAEKLALWWKLAMAQSG